MAMNHKPKPNTDQALIDAFLKKGGEIKKGETKPMPNELHISNNSWKNKSTKAEKEAKKGNKNDE